MGKAGTPARFFYAFPTLKHCIHKYATFILPADLKSAEGSALKSNFNSFKHFQIVLPSPAVQNSAAKSLAKQYNKIGRNFFMLENQTEKYVRSI